jgi:hypothetical protein
MKGGTDMNQQQIRAGNTGVNMAVDPAATVTNVVQLTALRGNKSEKGAADDSRQ